MPASFVSRFFGFAGRELAAVYTLGDAILLIILALRDRLRRVRGSSGLLCER